MRRTRISASISLVFLALLAGCAAPAEPDPAEDTAEESQSLECDRECMEAMVNKHLAIMGELGDEAAYERSLRELRAIGPEVVRAAVSAYRTWSLSAPPDPEEPARPGEMRWRATHLLGALGFREAIASLDAIAGSPLPEPGPDTDEQLFGDEFRVRLRAIAGLEKLGAAAELRAIYARGDLLRKPAAASLHALGIDIGDIRFVDMKTALAEDVADTTDLNPNAGRPPQPDTPGSREFRVTPRTDTPVLDR
ncbi:hypothetical protein BE08_42160 [Sorangium cellulosum]|uniref:Secreted protein n=1 Tax=Sorangium cellulosum TaxID=56 RepID=A0A150P3Q6_SORCE|nr:hypothetical protein BE08_42160 [Sorangium cellulosum]